MNKVKPPPPNTKKQIFDALCERNTEIAELREERKKFIAAIQGLFHKSGLTMEYLRVTQDELYKVLMDIKTEQALAERSGDDETSV